MAKMYIMGNYTEKAFQGFLKDPNSDRKAVVEKLVKGVGGTLHTMDIVRGSYDFCVVADLPSFDDFAAVKLVVCLLYTSPSPRDTVTSRMPSSA